MLEWFVVAFISMPSNGVEIKLLQESFDNKASCVKYMRETPGIINDIQKLEPRNTGMYFQCLDKNTIVEYKVKRKSI